MNFEELGISPDILKAISRMGFETPTPVQAQVIPRLLENKGDMVALAQTGTGKTAAFGLPILNMMEHDNRAPQALVLCPTRELCVQITRDLEAFAACLPTVNVVAVYGGTPIHTQLRALQKGVQIIVATPGRMLDILRRKKADLRSVKRVILDEADEMLNMGFQEDLEAILSEVPETAHTLLFSATMPRQVAAIARKHMKNAEEITVGQRNAGAENVSHECYIVHQRDRYAALKRLADYYPDMYAIVFCRTRQDTQNVATWLIRDGYNVDALHGDLSQVQRDNVMERFRSKTLQILVATDVAARGLDVTDLTHVINYNLPDDLGSYTHRSGRTGRAGKSGVSAIIINMREKGIVRRIEKMINKTFAYRAVPTGRDICEAQLLSMIERMKNVEVDHKQIDQYLPGIYESLKGMDMEELVKRFVSLEFQNLLKYYRGATDLVPEVETSRPQHRESRRRDDRTRRNERGFGSDRPMRRERDVSFVKPERRERDVSNDRPVRKERDNRFAAGTGRTVRMFINIGKTDGLNPTELADLVTNQGEHNVHIERVDIMKKYSFFEVPPKDISRVLVSLGMVTYNGREVRVEQVQDETKSKRFKRTERRKEPSPERVGGMPGAPFAGGRHRQGGSRGGQPVKGRARSDKHKFHS